MDNYKLIIFDFDGTIADTQQAIVECIQQTYCHFNFPIPEASKICKIIRTGTSMAKTFTLLCPELNKLDNATIAHWVQTYRNIYLQQGLSKTILYQDVNLVLQNLYARNKISIVLSSKGEKAIKNALIHYQLSSYIHAIYGDSIGAIKKPDTKVYSQRIHPDFPTIDFANILMVGDTKTDLVFANNLGIAACWARYGHGDETECLSLKPRYVIDKPIELLNI